MTGGFYSPLPQQLGGLHGQHRHTNQAFYGDPNTLARAQQAQAIAAQQAALITTLTGVGASESACLPVENEGIRLGEVIAWRAWEISDGWLYSVIANKTEWAPGQIMAAHKVGIPAGEGIHAFKTRRAAIDEYGLGSRRVVGQVALWGEIIEFEDGYHAEYAKIHSLDWMECPARRPSFWRRALRLESPASFLEDLQVRYGVGYAAFPSVDSAPKSR